MDGVLVDFNTGAYKVHKLTEEVVRKAMPPGGGFWNNYLPLSDEEFNQPLKDKFWLELEKTKWAEDIIELAEQYVGQKNICLLTAPTKYNATGKIKWIQKHYPQYSKQFYVGPNKYYCSSPLKILIDDHEFNIKAFEKGGGKGILFPAYCNRLYRKEKDPIPYVRKRLNNLIKLII